MSEANEDLKADILLQIADTHEHFAAMMNERLPEVDQETLELYLASLGKLVDKLEQRDKSLQQVAQETFGEIAGAVMRKM